MSLEKCRSFTKGELEGKLKRCKERQQQHAGKRDFVALVAKEIDEIQSVLDDGTYVKYTGKQSPQDRIERMDRQMKKLQAKIKAAKKAL